MAGGSDLIVGYVDNSALSNIPDLLTNCRIDMDLCLLRHLQVALTQALPTMSPFQQVLGGGHQQCWAPL
eukprot:11199863-Lingulodinium_polyedra.AAC.1